MPVKILTNHPGQNESPTWKRAATYIPAEGSGFISSLACALRMHLIKHRHDCVVLGSSRSNTFYALIQTFFPFGRKPCIMIDCLWYRSPSRLKALLKRMMMRLADKSVDVYTVWASREIRAYSEEFGLNPRKFVFVPYHTTLDNYDLKPIDKGFLFSGGNFARDYPTLIKAVRGLDYQLLIASTRPELFEGISIPENVTVKGFSHEEYLNRMASCSINIVPLQPGLLHSGGQQTFLNSMYLGKPTIVNDPEGASDYIDNGVDGVLVEPGDVEGLRKAITSLLSDKTLAAKIGENARRRVMGLSTEDHFRAIVRMAEDLIKNNKTVQGE